MKAGKIIRYIIIFVSMVICILWYYNYSIVLLHNGFKLKETSIISAGIDNGGKEYRVIKSKDAYGNVKFAYCSKEFASLWKIIQIADKPSDDTGMIAIGWSGKINVSRFNMEDNAIFEHEIHHVYYGRNALKLVDVPVEKLSSDITVSIEQNGTEYILHLISYGDADALNKVNIYELLKEEGYIR